MVCIYAGTAETHKSAGFSDEEIRMVAQASSCQQIGIVFGRMVDKLSYAMVLVKQDNAKPQWWITNLALTRERQDQE